MSYSIALAGKGGTGKTTLASLIVRFLHTRGKGPILAVDADPNSNLPEGLGLEVKETVGTMLTGFMDEKLNFPPGMTKETYMEYRLNELLVESKGIDLLAMGRGEGSGCYCYPNVILRKYIDLLTKNYPYVVLDNEAGMEHVSRRLSDHLDLMLIVSDYSLKGVRAAGRIRELIEELKFDVSSQYLILNRAPDELDANVRKEIEKQGVDLLGVVPVDDMVFRYDIEGKPIMNLPDESTAVNAISELMEKALFN